MTKALKSFKTSKIRDIINNDTLLLLKSWARDGYTLEEMAHKLNISYQALSRWKNQYKPIENAIKKGREVVDYEVENALLKRCLGGFKVHEIKQVMKLNKKTNKMEIDRLENIEKEVLPDPFSIAIWLNNRKPDEWKRNRDNFVSMNDENNHITVNVIQNKELKKEANDLQAKVDNWEDKDIIDAEAEDIDNEEE